MHLRLYFVNCYKLLCAWPSREGGLEIESNQSVSQSVNKCLLAAADVNTSHSEIVATLQ